MDSRDLAPEVDVNSNSGHFYTVRQGDYMAKIARMSGLTDWRAVWERPENEGLRALRRSPNILLPGDRVFIPDANTAQDHIDSDQRHSFRRKDTSIVFRTTVYDEDRRPRAGVAYTLRAGMTAVEGNADENGVVLEEIRPGTEYIDLDIDGEAVRILIGALDPIEDVSGIQARLANLGYDCGPVDGIAGPRTRTAVMAFQSDCEDLVVDGICGPRTRAKLQETYGS